MKYRESFHLLIAGMFLGVIGFALPFPYGHIIVAWGIIFVIISVLSLFFEPEEGGEIVWN